VGGGGGGGGGGGVWGGGVYGKFVFGSVRQEVGDAPESGGRLTLCGGLMRPHSPKFVRSNRKRRNVGGFAKRWSGGGARGQLALERREKENNTEKVVSWPRDQEKTTKGNKRKNTPASLNLSQLA